MHRDQRPNVKHETRVNSPYPQIGKDKRLLDNLRPINLLNTDYKILSGAIATRLKKGISYIISDTQSGFLK